MSVIWELDDDCQVVDVWYGRTVIHSSYKLFYEVLKLKILESVFSNRWIVGLIQVSVYIQFAQSVFDGASDEEILENVPELRHCPPESLKQKWVVPFPWVKLVLFWQNFLLC